MRIRELEKIRIRIADAQIFSFFRLCQDCFSLDSRSYFDINLKWVSTFCVCDNCDWWHFAFVYFDSRILLELWESFRVLKKIIRRQEASISSYLKRSRSSYDKHRKDSHDNSEISLKIMLLWICESVSLRKFFNSWRENSKKSQRIFKDKSTNDTTISKTLIS
jgi:hypothetical protein